MSDSPSAQVESSVQRGVLVLKIISARLNDYQQCTELGKQMVAAYGASGVSNVVVDLVDVEYVASVGFMPFLSLSRAVRKAGGQLSLCNFSEFVAEVFESTRMLINPNSPQAPLTSRPTLTEAIDRLTGSM